MSNSAFTYPAIWGPTPSPFVYPSIEPEGYVPPTPSPFSQSGLPFEAVAVLLVVTSFVLYCVIGVVWRVMRRGARTFPDALPNARVWTPAWVLVCGGTQEESGW